MVSRDLLVVGQKNGEYVECIYPSIPCEFSFHVILYSFSIASVGGEKISFCRFLSHESKRIFSIRHTFLKYGRRLSQFHPSFPSLSQPS